MKMIEVRQQNELEAKIAESIFTAATNELRAIYRPVAMADDNLPVNSIKVVATINDKVVGLAQYLIGTDSIKLSGLAVSPDYRRRGVAGAIVQYLVQEANNNRKADIVLGTIKETGNVDIFVRLGFTVIEEVIAEKFVGACGDKVTLVTMRKIAQRIIE